MNTNTKFETVDEYFSALPLKERKILKVLREVIKEAVPKAEEVISYNMPALKLNGIIIWYAAFKEHIGLYPRPSAIKAFKKELAKYESAKGTIRFPIDCPLPLGLIIKIVKFRAQENLENAKSKAKKKKMI